MQLYKKTAMSICDKHVFIAWENNCSMYVGSLYGETWQAMGCKRSERFLNKLYKR